MYSRKSAAGNVLRMWRGSHQARRATAAPNRAFSRSSTVCASVLITRVTPSSLARCACASLRSSLFGEALISSEVPLYEAARKMA